MNEKNEWKKDSTAKMEHCAFVNSAHIYQTRTSARAHTHKRDKDSRKKAHSRLENASVYMSMNIYWTTVQIKQVTNYYSCILSVLRC